MMDKIIIKGAREHNLKNVSLEIPKNELVVMTGVSGSGKSSLAFDTIFAEGQRRYVESLSTYARQFLGQMDKPDVDYIDGLTPAISIDQKSTSNNPRSTVGTVTEIYDYLRLLYARVGTPYCPVCGEEIKPQTIDEIVNSILTLPEGTKIQILAPIVNGKKGEFQSLFEELRQEGFVRVKADNEIFDLGVEELDFVRTAIGSYGVPEENFHIDLTIARGLDYYTKTVFEFEHSGFDGKKLTVAAGGRYDNLVGEIGGKPCAALGVGIGLDRVVHLVNTALVEPEELYYIANTDNINIEKIIPFAEKMRSQGKNVEINLANRSFKAQMKYANAINARYLIVVGQKELDDPQSIEIKDLLTGETSLKF